MRISDTNICGLCDSQPETIQHLLVYCDKSRDLWNDIKVWIQLTINFDLEITPTMILLGYSNRDNNNVPLNSILISVKYYIFSTAHSSKNMNIYDCQKSVQKMYEEQEQIAIINNKDVDFNKKWLRWKPLFR